MNKIQRVIIISGCLCALLAAANPPVSFFSPADGVHLFDRQFLWLWDVPTTGRVNISALSMRIAVVFAVTAALVFAFKPSKR